MRTPEAKMGRSPKHVTKFSDSFDMEPKGTEQERQVGEMAGKGKQENETWTWTVQGNLLQPFSEVRDDGYVKNLEKWRKK